MTSTGDVRGSGLRLVASDRVILDDTPDRLGSLTQPAAEALDDLAARDAVARTWARDHTLWRDDPTEIADRLGWLSVAAEMSAGLDGTAARCAALAAGVDHVLLAGMGGLEPVPRGGRPQRRHRSAGARRCTCSTRPTPPPSPASGAELPPERTLHVAASKSGSTLETRSHLAWAWERHPDPARFAAITDPGSDLAALAADRGFAATFENPPDIGGRYSALSYFGLVPALLAGADVGGLLGLGGRHVRPAARLGRRQPGGPPGRGHGRRACAPAATS